MENLEVCNDFVQDCSREQKTLHTSVLSKNNTKKPKKVKVQKAVQEQCSSFSYQGPGLISLLCSAPTGTFCLVSQLPPPAVTLYITISGKVKRGRVMPLFKDITYIPLAQI